MRSLSRFDYNFDFIGKRLHTTLASSILVIIALFSIIYQGLVLGIDFTGGVLVEVGYSNAVTLDGIRDKLHSNGFEDAVVQYFGTTSDVLIRLGVHEEINDQTLSTKILTLLQQEGQQVDMRRIEFVGPQVGNELIEDGGLAVLYTLIGILIYVAFRFEYRFAIGAVVALMHDTIITVGYFSLFRVEFDLTVLAAILAVIGYSLNDTVVVFDRVRENFLKFRKKDTIEIMNLSNNEVLSRTIMTSVLTLLVVVVLFFTGGELIHGFATALIIGIVVGTYSSIYIASIVTLALGVSRTDLAPVPKEGIDKSE